MVKKKTDSLYDLEVEFQTLFYNMQSDDNEISASSQSVDSTDIFSSILKEMTKSPFDISITRHGIVEDVKMENLFENLFNLNPDIPRLERARIIYLTKQSFGEKAMKGSIEMLTAIYPSKPVEKGDEWKNQIRLETIFGETMENKFVLTELSNDFAIINVQSKTISDDNDSFIKTGDHLLRMKSTGSMSSTYKIDKNSGWIIESETHQDISGIIETKWREDSIIILKIPFEYNGSIKIKAE
ncbi:MAG TPA: DUF6263 family protein [Aequorivita sp.]|nr:DUF6263 family protein [Aequorivita sp.]